MHHLGYELPERTGFRGLWEGSVEAIENNPTVGDVESSPEVVARSLGASKPETRAAVAAFRRSCCNTVAVA